MLNKIKTLKELLLQDAIKLDIPVDDYIKDYYSEEERIHEFTKHVTDLISGHFISSKDLLKITFSSLKKYLNLNYNSNIDVHLYEVMIIQFNDKLKNSNSKSANAWKEYGKTEKAKSIVKENGIKNGNKYKGKFFKEWAEQNPEESYESSKRGALTKCHNDMVNGTGLFGLSDEERSINGANGVKAFWDNATPEEIEAKYNKASESMKEVVKEKGWWNPHEYISEELRRSMTTNMKKTKKNQKIKNLEDLHSRVDHHEWMNLEEAYDIVNSYRNASMSTVRRMMYSWEEANQFFETKYIPNSTGNGQKNILVRKKF